MPMLLPTVEGTRVSSLSYTEKDERMMGNETTYHSIHQNICLRRQHSFRPSPLSLKKITTDDGQRKKNSISRSYDLKLTQDHSSRSTKTAA